MEPKLQRRVQRYGWDRAASSYEQYWRQRLAPAQNRLVELAALQPGERVLDVACGTGLVTFRAAEAVGPSGEVIGTDISRAMVETSQQVAAQRNLEQVRFERADAEDLPFPDNTFNVALCALGRMFVPTPLKALQEWSRVLCPGGRAVAAVWGHRERCGWADVFPIIESRVQSDVCPLFFQLGTQHVLQQAFQGAGFLEVKTERMQTSLHFESSEEACGAVFAGGAVALAYTRFDTHTRHDVHAEYLASIDAYGNGNSYTIPGEFVMVSGRKP
jgi:ubiquinone/menaquinone biosynthesis C-methylase UbiE